VGSARIPVVVEADGRWYIGPDNGLFEIVQRRSSGSRTWEITWQREALSASFHGRDLFAPVAAQLARGELPPNEPRAADIGRFPTWPDDLPEVVYIDHYGNAMTGLRAAVVRAGMTLGVAARRLLRARTFSDVPPGAAFWYENANGLAEIAVNLGRAEADLGLRIGSPVSVLG
jgi:S-adenosylmethionine hydrolase